MQRLARLVVLCPLASALLTLAQTSGGRIGPAAASPAAAPGCSGDLTYEQLTADERKPPAPRTMQMGSSLVELTIQQTQYAQKAADARVGDMPFECEWDILVVGVEVSTTGELASFANGRGALRGGGGGKLDAEDFARLEELLRQLPDDHRRVPPASRRVIVELEKDGVVQVRVYDTADLPMEIAEMIHITGAPIAPVMPMFKPDTVLPSDLGSPQKSISARHGVEQAVSPDGSICVQHDFTTKTLTVYERETNGHCGTGGKVIQVIPEFWQPNVYGGYAVGSEFSPDGDYLLVRWGSHVGAVFLDTRTWKPVADPRTVPQDLKEYLPNSDWSLGVVVTGTGRAYLWNQQAHRILAELPGLGELADPPVISDGQGNRIYTEKLGTVDAAAFSPDGTRVAIWSGASGSVKKMQLGIFEVQTGKKLEDLSAAVRADSSTRNLQWWNEGRWLIASHTIVDAETGRSLGTMEFSGCATNGDVAEDGTNLLLTCSAGYGHEARVLEWTADGVAKQLNSFREIVGAGKELPN